MDTKHGKETNFSTRVKEAGTNDQHVLDGDRLEEERRVIRKVRVCLFFLGPSMSS